MSIKWTPKRAALAASPLALLALTAAGCGGSNGSTVAQNETNAVNHNFATMERTQPVPEANSSQLRQTIIDAEQAQLHGIATTSFFYGNNGGTPIFSCPSLGFPVPATDQLTSPEKASLHGQYNDGTIPLPQGEPTGVYTGQTSGTYVVCVTPGGQKQVDYWEGDVYTAGGAAHFANGHIVEDTSTVNAKVTH